MPAATIFPAPVIPSSLPENGAKADVVNYVCHGEALTELTSSGRTGSFWRDLGQNAINQYVSGTQHRRLGTDFWVSSNGGNPLSRHDLANIVL